MCVVEFLRLKPFALGCVKTGGGLVKPVLRAAESVEQ
jgi:hypothetical protein